MRVTFARMAMTMRKPLALTAGRHTVGKCHGNLQRDQPGPTPEGADLKKQGPGWMNVTSRGVGRDTMSSEIEAPLDHSP